MCLRPLSGPSSVLISMLGPKSSQIRQMFSCIAPRYDLLNHLLSLNIDRRWRKRVAALLRDSVRRPDAQCLDLCCGTGDVSLELLRQGASRVVASDFSHPMLQLNVKKLCLNRKEKQVWLVESDALHLPFGPNMFDALCIAFGLRNLEDPALGLLEMHRVLKPGGRLVVLEFSKPTNALVNLLFRLYSFRVLPAVGALLSHHPHAYNYLPESVREFPDQVRLERMLVESNFEGVGHLNLSGGIAAIHFGQKGS